MSSPMSAPPPNKTPRIIAIVVCILVVFLIWDNYRPRPKPALVKLVTTPSGLRYYDLKVGDGLSPKPGQQVTVHYVGKLTDGAQFDSSRDRGTPFAFTIGQHQVIKGWEEGIMTMKVGGRRQLIVPSELGYGQGGNPAGRIPPNATLIFDVELLSVK